MANKKVPLVVFVGALLAIIVLSGCPIPGGGSGGSGGSSSTSATTMLSNLGVTAVASPPAATVTTQTGTTMTVDPSTWQPLKNKYAVFAPQAELFQAGGSPDGTSWNSFYENSSYSTPYEMTSPFITGGGSGGWEQKSAKTSVAADLTGDGVDNIVVFYVNASAEGF